MALSRALSKNLDEYDEPPLKEQIKYFVKTKRRQMQAIIVCLVWFINVLQNYGLNFELGHLQGDILVNSAISNITGFVGCYLAYPVLLYAKRKPGQIIGFTITLIGSFAYIFLDSMYAQYALIFLIKFGISLTFILIYCFTTELYPT